MRKIFIVLVMLLATSCSTSEEPLSERLPTTNQPITTDASRAEDRESTTTRPPATTPTTADRERPSTSAPQTTPTTAGTPQIVINNTPTTAVPTTSAPVTAVDTSDDGADGWRWLLLVLVVIALIAGIAAIVSNRKGKAEAASSWEQRSSGLVDSASLVRDLMVDGARDPQQQSQITARVQDVAANADVAASTTSDPAARNAAMDVAASLREFAFANEAQDLLRKAETPPTAEQLTRADETRRARLADLDSAIERLRGIVR